MHASSSLYVLRIYEEDTGGGYMHASYMYVGCMHVAYMMHEEEDTHLSYMWMPAGYEEEDTYVDMRRRIHTCRTCGCQRGPLVGRCS